VLETDNDVVGIPHDDDLTSGVALTPPVCPEVEEVMEVDIGQQRRNDSSYTKDNFEFRRVISFQRSPYKR
jgi:hypothetical protein